MSKGMFIVFEGIDGAGKSTQVRILAEKLEKLGKKVYITAEPTTLPSGVELRRVLSGNVKKTPAEIAIMFAEDRVAHNQNAECGIERMLEEGAFILCDRYYYSSLAYQGSQTSYEWVRTLNTRCPEIRHPDICIFLDLTPEESMKRITAGRDSTEIYESEEILARVRDTFMKVLEDMSSEDKIEIIDASKDIDSIAERVFAAISPLI
ncbi:MAG: dTMP kinase [Clostridia bacterium]|nr:dTMP kinase [Clostridia bacterium]